MLAAIDALAAAHSGGTIALFTHGGVLDVLYRAATGLGLQDARTWEIGNTAVNRPSNRRQTGSGFILRFHEGGGAN